MDVATFVAKVLALLYLSAGIAALTGKMTFAKIVDDFQKSPALTYVTGMFAILVGMLIIQFHNVWVKDWTVLVTIVGWAAMLKGIMFIAAPEMMSSFKPMYKNTSVWGFILLAIGLIFGYLGFFI